MTLTTRSPFVTRTLACFVAATCVLGGGTAVAKPSNREALDLLQRGAALYQEEKYDEAIEAYEKGYALEEDSAFLYAIAQAERQRGNCASAVKHYRRYLKSNPSEAGAALAKEGMVRCAEQLAEEGPPPDETSLEPPTSEGRNELDPFLRDDEGLMEVEQPAPVASTETRKWHRDPVGATLVAVGLAGSAAGVGVLVAARGELEAARASGDYGDFHLHKSRYDTFTRAGAIVTGVGGALLLGGAIRWTILGVRARKQMAVTPTVGFGLTGLSVRGRF